MNRLRKSAVARLLCLGFVGGCVLTDVPAGEVARLAGRSISSEEWNQYVTAQAGTIATNLDSRVLSQLMDQYLDELLMVQWAQDEGWLRADLPTEHILQEILDRLARGEITPQQEARWVEAHAADLRQPERVRMLHVLRHEREEAEAVRDQLTRYGSLLESESDESSGVDEPSGEDEVVELPVEALPEVFVDVVRDLEEGQVSPLISTSAGHHLLWIEERIPARGLSAEETRLRARAALRREHTARRTREVVLAARDRYNAKVWPQNLPFEYQGAYIAPDADETYYNDADFNDTETDDATKLDPTNEPEPSGDPGGIFHQRAADPTDLEAEDSDVGSS